MSKSNRPYYIPTDDCSAEFMFFASQPRIIDRPSNLVTADDVKNKKIPVEKLIDKIKVDKKPEKVGLPSDIYEKEISTPRNGKS